MKSYTFRLVGGRDLKASIQAAVERWEVGAGFVITCVGSLSCVNLRMAGAKESVRLEGDFEIVSLEGTLSTNGCHLHLSVSDSKGAVTGGHLLEGCLVRTTAEIVIGDDPAFTFSREEDPATGFNELRVSPRIGQ